MKEWFQSYLETRKQTYINDPAVCISFYKEEKQRTQEYYGRQIVELIQNAEDEAPPGQGKIEIWLEQDSLTIANNGKPFSSKGLESLMTPNVSAKLKDDQKIGVKGLGFRSLLNWSHQIDIISGDLAIRFSRESAISFLKEIYENHPSVNERHQDTLTDEYPIATLAAPSWIEKPQVDTKEYTTFIRIHFDSHEIHDDIEKQLNRVDGVELLFLHNTRKVVINEEDFITTIEKEEAGENVQIQKKRNDQIVFDKSWSVYQKSGEISDDLRVDNSSPKHYDLKLALSKELKDSPDRLYSYFRTKVHFSFPAYIHGTFELSGDRNALMSSKTNHFLINELIQLLIDTALDLTKDEVSWKAMSLLSFDDATASALSDFNFEEKLKAKIKTNNLFPTIYDNYVAYDSQPVYYKGNFSRLIDYTKYGKFKNLCQYSENAKVHTAYNRLKGYIYLRKSISETFSEISHKLTLRERVKCLLYLNKNPDKFDYPPELLIDSDGHVIKNGEEVFSLPESKTIHLPKYVKLRFLNDGLLNEIKTQTQVRTNREAIKKIDEWDITEYAFTPIFNRAVKAEKVEREHEDDEKKLKPISQLLDCLLKIYEEDSNIPKLSAIELPNRNKEFKPADELYLGKEYKKGELNEQLLNANRDDLFVIGSEELQQSENKLFVDLLKWLDVKSQIEVIETEVPVPDEYVGEIFQNVSFPKTSESYKVTYPSLEELKNRTWGREIASVTIEEIDQVLETADPEIILYWIITNSEISNHLIHFKEDESTFYFSQPNKRYKDYITVNAPSYLGYKLAYSPWIIDTNDKRVSPKDCIMVGGSLGLGNILSVPEINYSHPIFVNNSISRDRVDVTLKELGVRDNFSELNNSTIYQILLSLPEIDETGTYSRNIYDLVYEALKDRVISSSEKDDFFESGKVLAKINNQREYVPIEKAYYLANLTLSKAIRNQLPLFVLGRRLSKSKIHNIFGVKAIEEVEYKLNADPTLHGLNDELSLDIEEFKLFFYCTRLGKDADQSELNKLKRLNISFVTDIIAEYSIDSQNWTPLNLKLNEYLQVESAGQNQAYIKISPTHTSIRDIKEDIQLCDTVNTVITNWLDLTEDFSYLFSMTSNGRHQWLELNYPDGDEILERAKVLFNQIELQKTKFWDAIYELLKKKLPEPFSKTEEFFIDKLGTEYFESVSSSLNYHRLSIPSNYSILKKLFASLNITIEGFNEYSSNKIEFSQHLREELDRLLREYEQKFAKSLFDKVSSQSIQEKGAYFDLITAYENELDIEIQNSFDYHPEFELKQWISSKFHMELTFEDVLETWLVDALNERKKEFSDEYSKVNANELSQSEMSLILFGEYEEAHDSYVNRNQATEDQSNIDTQSNSNNGLFDELEKEVAQGNVKIKESKFKKGQTKNSGQGSRRKGRNAIPKGISDDRKLEIGEAGEIVVFHILDKDDHVTNLKWVSKFAEKHKKTVRGDDSLGFDFTFIDNRDNKIKYVEVKASTTDQVQFHLSRNEFDVGSNKGLDYQIYMVTHVESKDRTVYPITDIFDKDIDFMYNDIFEAIPDGYVVSFLEVGQLNEISM